jgi:hypothetical protein
MTGESAGELEAVPQRDKIQAITFHLLNIAFGRVARVLAREFHVTDPFSNTPSRRIRRPWEISEIIEERKVPDARARRFHSQPTHSNPSSYNLDSLRRAWISVEAQSLAGPSNRKLPIKRAGK